MTAEKGSPRSIEANRLSWREAEDDPILGATDASGEFAALERLLNGKDMAQLFLSDL
jgi:hypothetical protein